MNRYRRPFRGQSGHVLRTLCLPTAADDVLHPNEQHPKCFSGSTAGALCSNAILRKPQNIQPSSKTSSCNLSSSKSKSPPPTNPSLIPTSNGSSISSKLFS